MKFSFFFNVIRIIYNIVSFIKSTVITAAHCCAAVSLGDNPNIIAGQLDQSINNDEMQASERKTELITFDIKTKNHVIFFIDRCCCPDHSER